MASAAPLLKLLLLGVLFTGTYARLRNNRLRPPGPPAAVSTTARTASLLSSRRPIITGCYDACGADDQVCVTECQVCVESRHCRTLRDYDCVPCVEQVNSNKQNASTADPFLRDSGGIPIRHEKVRQELQQARFEALDAKRMLRRARSGVIAAQRKLEWSSEELLAEEKKVRTWKANRLRDQANAAKWEIRKAQKLRELRNIVKERRRAHKRTVGELHAAELRLSKAKEWLEVEEQRTAQRAPGAEKEVKAARAIVAETQEDIAELKRMESAQWRGLQRSKSKLRRHLEESRWMGSGLRHDSHSASTASKALQTDLETVRSMEKLSMLRLDAAKEVYVHAANVSVRCDERVEELEKELRKFPLERPLEDEEDIFSLGPHQVNTAANTTNVTSSKHAASGTTLESEPSKPFLEWFPWPPGPSV